jgi:transmembrane sensor
MKPITNQFLKDKLNQYQNGQLSAEESEIIDKWFEANLLAAESAPALSDVDQNQLYLELIKPVKEAISQQRNRIYKLPNLWLKVACTIILISAVAWFTFNNRNSSPADSVISYQTFQTPKGTVKTITLQDGTKIWMNAGTTIRVASNFNASKYRKILLDEGEAFFEVKRDTLRPFSIATKNLLTTVLGTSFNIRTYPGSDVYQVAVATGKVRVEQRNGVQLKVLSKGLVKGQVLTQQLLAGTTVINHQDAAQISNWKRNRSMYLDNLTLSQIGEELSRQYAIEVKVNADPRAKKTYRIHLQHQDLKIVLQQLAMETGINYQLTTSKLTLNPAPQ